MLSILAVSREVLSQLRNRFFSPAILKIAFRSISLVVMPLLNSLLMMQLKSYRQLFNKEIIQLLCNILVLCKIVLKFFVLSFEVLEKVSETFLSEVVFPKLLFPVIFNYDV